jgi:AcrR family transcriptional regulator
MPRRVDHAARLTEIEDTVIAIASESGFEAVTIRAVATRVGASTSVVTHYVGSRDELLHNAIQRELASRQADADAATHGLDGAAALRAFIEWAILGPDERTHRFWLALVMAAGNQPQLRAELDGFNEWWDRRLRHLLDRAQVANPEIARDLLGVFVDGVVVSGFDAGQPWPIDRRTVVLNMIWQTLGVPVP